MAIKFLADQTIDDNLSVPTLTLSSIVNAGTDTDKFLVLDSSGNVDFRTGAQVRSDIGAGTGTVTGSGTSGRLAKFNSSTALTDSRIFESGTGTFIKETTSYPLTIQNDGSISTVEFEGLATANSSNIQITPGTQSKPAINFGKRSGTGAGDTNTGIYSETADQVNIAAGGAEAAAFTADGVFLGVLNAASSASVFLTVDGANIKSRTAAQVRSDIGAGTSDYSGWKLDGDTSGSVVSIGSGDTVDFIGGTGIDCSAASGAKLTITNTAPDQTVALTAGTGISISGTYPNFTITNSSPSSGGTVTSVGATTPINSSGGTTPTISIDNATGTTVGAAALQAGTGISVSDANGVYTVTADNNGTVTGSGTANNVPKWSSSSALTDSEISDTGSVIKLGKDASSQETLYLDTVNRKVGFRTSSPGSAFDVNGTIRVRNQLNVGNTTEQNLFVNGGSGGQFVKFGNYGETGSGSQGNYFGITSSENQPKFIAAFGDGGKVVQAKRVVTIKLTAAALNDSFTNAGKILIPAQGSNNIIWPTQLLIYRGPGNAGTGWTTGTNVGATFYFCESDPACGLSERKNIAVIAGGVCGSAGEWFWGRPVPLPTVNENPNVKWKLNNKPLRFRTNGNVNNATMDWYIRIEYIQMNISAGLTGNVDITVS